MAILRINSLTEDPDLASLGKRRDKVDHLDAGFQHLGPRTLLRQCRREPMDGRALYLGAFHRASSIDCSSQHVEDPAQSLLPDGHGDRRAGAQDPGPAGDSFGGPQRKSPHFTVFQDELGLQDKRGGASVAFKLESLMDRGHLSPELHVYHGPMDPDDPAFDTTCITVTVHAVFPVFARSKISFVILSWRVLLYRRVKDSATSRAFFLAFCMATIRAPCSDEYA
jgi:hypothetical protein